MSRCSNDNPRRSQLIFVVLLLIALFLSGCESNGTIADNLAPPGRVGSAQFQAKAKEIRESLRALRVDAIGDKNVNKNLVTAPGPIPFTATGSFTLPAHYFSFYVYPEAGNTTLFGDTNGFSPAQIPPAESFSGTALDPVVSASVQFDTASVIEGGITLGLQNLQNQDSYTFGPGLPSNANYVFNDTTVDNVTGDIHSFWFATVRLPSGEAVLVGQGVSFQLGAGTETFYREVGFIRPQEIMIDNPTVIHGDSAQNTTTLDFQISHSSSTTLNAWSVAAVQNGTILKSFLPTVDTRGPGVTNGDNPLNVSLAWNGIDSTNHPVVGNFTWVVTANTTDFVTGGALNDGVNSTQVFVADAKASLSAVIKRMSSNVITMVDVKNKPITLPQYDIDKGKKDPIALPIKDYFSTVNVTLSVTIPPGSNPKTYFFWGENPAGVHVFGPTQHTPIDGNNTISFPVKLTDIGKYPAIKWYYIAKEGDEQGFLGATDSPVYVTADLPEEPQAQPRVDVIDYAVRQAVNARDERSIARLLTFGIYNNSGYTYDVIAKHTEISPGAEKFIVSDFIEFPGNRVEPIGNCQDFSNLFQVCCAALGVKNTYTLNINGRANGFFVFDTKPVLPIGQTEWRPFRLALHRINMIQTDDSLYDPTYLMNQPSPVPVVNLTKIAYTILFWNRPENDNQARLFFLSPKRPTSVE